MRHAAQSCSEPEPAAEKVPLGHSVQVALPTPAQRPAAHCVHDPSHAAAANPALHWVIALLPSHQLPEGHDSHRRFDTAVGAVASYSAEAQIVTATQREPSFVAENVVPAAQLAQTRSCVSEPSCAVP